MNRKKILLEDKISLVNRSSLSGLDPLVIFHDIRLIRNTLINNNPKLEDPLLVIKDELFEDLSKSPKILLKASRYVDYQKNIDFIVRSMEHKPVILYKFVRFRLIPDRHWEILSKELKDFIENIISTSSEASVKYARFCTKKRFIKGEHLLLKNGNQKDLYLQFLKDLKEEKQNGKI